MADGQADIILQVFWSDAEVRDVRYLDRLALLRCQLFLGVRCLGRVAVSGATGSLAGGLCAGTYLSVALTEVG